MSDGTVTVPTTDVGDGLSPYVRFTHEEWGRLRAATPLTLTESDLAELRGINEQLSLDEVAQIYLPLSRLLNLYVAASQGLARTTDTFLGKMTTKVPYVVGIAGSVAVGKSTTARVLQALLRRWPDHPKVELVTTDGFLYPNRELEARGLMERKGFPESYDLRRLLRFMSDMKAGVPHVEAPLYSHLIYDVMPDQRQVIEQPDIVIVEGLNVLQTGVAPAAGPSPQLFVSDFFDFSIYVDADEADIRTWYVERFLTLRATAFQDRSSFFHRFARLDESEAVTMATGIWTSINGVNLAQNILPTRGRAKLILEKGPDHSTVGVLLRKQ